MQKNHLEQFSLSHLGCVSINLVRLRMYESLHAWLIDDLARKSSYLGSTMYILILVVSD